jgi:acetyltransferase-like isoleucine patch superfamily enzyme
MKGLNLWATFKIIMIIFIVYILVLIPPGLIFKYGAFPLFSKGFYSFLLGLLLLLVNVWVLLFSGIFFPGVCWRILNLRYSGTQPLELSNKDVKNWLLSQLIYLPTAVILDFFHLYTLKTLHVQLFGGKVGKNVVMGGFVTDPSLIEVGDNTVVGGFSTIVGHSVERGKIYFKKVIIDKNCGVGIRATILAGARMEDGSLLGAHSLLVKNAKIPFKKTFGGVPARNLDK